MRKWISMLCVLLLIALAWALPQLRAALPMETQPLIEKKYGGWSGVLRLWVCEGWPVGAGSAAAWLNACIGSFERAHPGVYVQPEYVDAAAIRALRDGSLFPPDMLLVPPGLLDSADGLAELCLSRLPREPFADCGILGGARFAVPVLAGGYLWACNAALLDGIPGSWRDAEQPIAAPPDEPWRQWSAALLALCSARYSEGSAEATDERPAGELDLGLAPMPEATPSPTPAPDSGGLDCRLPEGFAPSAEAWRDFVNGECAAIPVTQREVRRLEQLSAQGRGPDWQLAAAGAGAFTDQLLLAAIVDSGADDEALSKRDLCAAFVDHLLGDDCQGALHRIGAFSVTGAPSGYAAGDSLLAMEQRLRDSGLTVPRCFDAAWRAEAEAIVRKFIDDAAPAPALWRELSARLSQKPEH